MAEKPTVVEALARVMEDVRAVRKGDRNSQQNYAFRGIDAVMNAAGPALRKHGVIVVPLVEEIHYRDVQTSTGKASRECTVKVRYRFHGPAGDHIDCVTPGESMDFGDKGAPKAMSVAFRIALLQALCLPTDDPEPDSHHFERGAGPVQGQRSQDARGGAQNGRQASAGPARDTRPPADTAPAQDDTGGNPEAFAVIESATKEHGWDPRKVAARYKQQFGEDPRGVKSVPRATAFVKLMEGVADELRPEVAANGVAQ